MKPYPSSSTVRLYMMFTSRRNLALGLGAIALSTAALVLSGCGDTTAQSQPPARSASVTVNVVSPVQTTFDRALPATGTVNPRDELIVGSDAAGVRLMEVLVDVGSVVTKGQL